MDWRPWLERWSEEWIRAADETEKLEPDVVRDRWLGYAPATRATVEAAEERLGVRLPPSYREFLLTTDGWRDAGIFVWRMSHASELGWVRDLQSYWTEWDDLTDAEDGETGPVTRGLLISAEADAGILFLDPGDIDEDGEWAAYSLFSWRAAPPVRHASFRALMESLYAEFHLMRQPDGPTHDEWVAKVEQARIDALAGAVDEAEAVFRRAEEFGITRARLLHAQLLCFMGRDGEAVGAFAGLLGEEGVSARALFAEEFLPLMFLDHERRYHTWRSALQSVVAADDPELVLLVAEHHARRRRGEAVLSSFGNAAFDTAVHDALDRHAGDPAALRRAVLDALPLWTPRTPDHIAPVALLAEPALAAAFEGDHGVTC
ncbi:SMI1/KNR4 family protein [Actinomadura gamaensis]|uniref:SMI1/KNR4 family protein n=1 Tax=Actinomadura gamaensis TaxID=1763541 RepID=A0ABV9U2H8_9ACTN